MVWCMGIFFAWSGECLGNFLLVIRGVLWRFCVGVVRTLSKYVLRYLNHRVSAKIGDKLKGIGRNSCVSKISIHENRQ